MQRGYTSIQEKRQSCWYKRALNAATEVAQDVADEKKYVKESIETRGKQAVGICRESSCQESGDWSQAPNEYKKSCTSKKNCHLSSDQEA